MACPGGCVNGGGQPYVDYTKCDYYDVARLRAKLLYQNDKLSKDRKSHKNQSVVDIYNDYLNPNNLSHQLLHHHKK